MSKLAFFDSSHEMPEEIISAAGLIPYKILGDVHNSNDPADQYLPNFSCPAARSWLTEALAKSDEWAGIVIAQGCNTTNRNFDIWKLHVKTPFLYWLNCPLRDNDTAGKFFKSEIKGLINALEEQFKIQITDEKIKTAIKESNEIKKRLKKLSSLRNSKDIPNSEFLKVIMKALQRDKKSLIEELDATLKDWENRPPFPSDKKRVLLTGSDVTFPEWLDLLDQAGLRVVRDDLSIGERYFTNLIPDREDPLDSLVYYYFNIPKPATRPTMKARIDNLMKILDETPVDGVISQNLKFCEPYAYDSVLVNEAIKSRNVKVLHLERLFSPLEDQQSANRLEAFKELL